MSARGRLIAAVLAALALGIAVGYVWRRQHDPTPEERARDAAERLQKDLRDLLR